jgi:hypothetical protein
MILISHRGNLNGAAPDLENTLGYIDTAIKSGFDVEIDVWGIEGRLWLGHDAGVKSISTGYLHDNFDRLWVHCKNIEAINMLHAHAPLVRHFWHQKDDYTMVSNGLVWCFPGKQPPAKGGIVVMPELLMTLDAIRSYWNQGVYGICSDFVGVLKDHK